MRALTYIEIDVPSFEPASPEEIVTYRFTYDCGYAPRSIEAIPSLGAVSYSPATLSLGKDLGTRATLACSFIDHKHIFGAEPFDQGTFFGKFRARHGMTLQGRALRWVQGLEGQTLEQMETRHFIIESTDGPTPKGTYSIAAKDILKLADGDRAQAPAPSNGFMVGSLTDVGVSLTLSPTGIGDAEYDTSGYLALGGEECVSFTRSGDVVTLTGRGQLGTVAAAHDAGSRVQTILRYVGESPATIIYDLLVNYAGVNPAYIPLTSWENEVDAFLQQNYSANIADPTDVNKLISEIIEQAALVVWWEPLTQQIRLQVLRAIPTTAAVFSEDNTIEGSLTIKEQPTTRISQVLTYFGQRDPLAPIDEERNFRSSVLTIDGDAELAYRTSSLRKVYSRWIPFGARTVATRLNGILLGRFRDPPRRFTLNLFRYGDENPQLGGGYRLTSWAIQDTTGLPDNAPLQITRLNPLSDRYEIEAEEMLFDTQDPSDLVNRTIIIDAAINNINIRDIHDSIYPDPDAGASPAESLTVIIEQNVVVGSIEPNLVALTVGDWPVGYPITFQIYGRVQGAGGNGGGGEDGNQPPAEAGGTAFYTRFPVDVEIMDGGGIWGGGGGGGAYIDEEADPDVELGGGGGAGSVPGDGGSGIESDNKGPGEAGTPEQGGAGASADFKSAGDGGDPGEAGTSGTESGGAAGSAIDGVSYVTLTDTSPSGILGPEVN
jgi:hypothetical protein